MPGLFPGGVGLSVAVAVGAVEEGTLTGTLPEDADGAGPDAEPRDVGGAEP